MSSSRPLRTSNDQDSARTDSNDEAGWSSAASSSSSVSATDRNLLYLPSPTLPSRSNSRSSHSSRRGPTASLAAFLGQSSSSLQHQQPSAPQQQQQQQVQQGSPMEDRRRPSIPRTGSSSGASPITWKTMKSQHSPVPPLPAASSNDPSTLPMAPRLFPPLTTQRGETDLDGEGDCDDPNPLPASDGKVPTISGSSKGDVDDDFASEQSGIDQEDEEEDEYNSDNESRLLRVVSAITSPSQPVTTTTSPSVEKGGQPSSLDGEVESVTTGTAATQQSQIPIATAGMGLTSRLAGFAANRLRAIRTGRQQQQPQQEPPRESDPPPSQSPNEAEMNDEAKNKVDDVVKRDDGELRDPVSPSLHPPMSQPHNGDGDGGGAEMTLEVELSEASEIDDDDPYAAAFGLASPRKQQKRELDPTPPNENVTVDEHEEFPSIDNVDVESTESAYKEETSQAEADKPGIMPQKSATQRFELPRSEEGPDDHLFQVSSPSVYDNDITKSLEQDIDEDEPDVESFSAIKSNETKGINSKHVEAATGLHDPELPEPMIVDLPANVQEEGKEPGFVVHSREVPSKIADVDQEDPIQAEASKADIFAPATGATHRFELLQHEEAGDHAFQNSLDESAAKMGENALGAGSVVGYPEEREVDEKAKVDQHWPRSSKVPAKRLKSDDRHYESPVNQKDHVQGRGSVVRTESAEEQQQQQQEGQHLLSSSQSLLGIATEDFEADVKGGLAEKSQHGESSSHATRIETLEKTSERGAHERVPRSSTEPAVASFSRNENAVQGNDELQGEKETQSSADPAVVVLWDSVYSPPPPPRPVTTPQNDSPPNQEPLPRDPLESDQHFRGRVLELTTPRPSSFRSQRSVTNVESSPSQKSGALDWEEFMQPVDNPALVKTPVTTSTTENPHRLPASQASQILPRSLIRSAEPVTYRPGSRHERDIISEQGMAEKDGTYTSERELSKLSKSTIESASAQSDEAGTQLSSTKSILAEKPSKISETSDSGSIDSSRLNPPSPRDHGVGKVSNLAPHPPNPQQPAQPSANPAIQEKSELWSLEPGNVPSVPIIVHAASRDGSLGPDNGLDQGHIGQALSDSGLPPARPPTRDASDGERSQEPSNTLAAARSGSESADLRQGSQIVDEVEDQNRELESDLMRDHNERRPSDENTRDNRLEGESSAVEHAATKQGRGVKVFRELWEEKDREKVIMHDRKAKKEADMEGSRSIKDSPAPAPAAGQTAGNDEGSDNSHNPLTASGNILSQAGDFPQEQRVDQAQELNSTPIHPEAPRNTKTSPGITKGSKDSALSSPTAIPESQESQDILEARSIAGRVSTTHSLPDTKDRGKGVQAFRALWEVKETELARKRIRDKNAAEEKQKKELEPLSLNAVAKKSATKNPSVNEMPSSASAESRSLEQASTQHGEAGQEANLDSIHVRSDQRSKLSNLDNEGRAKPASGTSNRGRGGRVKAFAALWEEKDRKIRESASTPVVTVVPRKGEYSRVGEPARGEKPNENLAVQSASPPGERATSDSNSPQHLMPDMTAVGLDATTTDVPAATANAGDAAMRQGGAGVRTTSEGSSREDAGIRSSDVHHSRVVGSELYADEANTVIPQDKQPIALFEGNGSSSQDNHVEWRGEGLEYRDEQRASATVDLAPELASASHRPVDSADLGQCQETTEGATGRVEESTEALDAAEPSSPSKRRKKEKKKKKKPKSKDKKKGSQVIEVGGETSSDGRHRGLSLPLAAADDSEHKYAYVFVSDENQVSPLTPRQTVRPGAQVPDSAEGEGARGTEEIGGMPSSPPLVADGAESWTEVELSDDDQHPTSMVASDVGSSTPFPSMTSPLQGPPEPENPLDLHPGESQWMQFRVPDAEPTWGIDDSDEDDVNDENANTQTQAPGPQRRFMRSPFRRKNALQVDSGTDPADIDGVEAIDAAKREQDARNTMSLPRLFQQIRRNRNAQSAPIEPPIEEADDEYGQSDEVPLFGLGEQGENDPDEVDRPRRRRPMFRTPFRARRGGRPQPRRGQAVPTTVLIPSPDREGLLEPRFGAEDPKPDPDDDCVIFGSSEHSDIDLESGRRRSLSRNPPSEARTDRQTSKEGSENQEVIVLFDKDETSNREDDELFGPATWEIGPLSTPGASINQRGDNKDDHDDDRELDDEGNGKKSNPVDPPDVEVGRQDPVPDEERQSAARSRTSREQPQLRGGFVPPDYCRILFLASMVMIGGTIGTAYYGTRLALDDFDSEGVVGPAGQDNNEGFPATARPSFVMEAPAPTMAPIFVASPAATVSPTQPDNPCPFDDDALLEFFIEFDSKPEDVGIVLSDGGSLGTAIWSFQNGTFQSFSQFQRNNLFQICLSQRALYQFAITDTATNGLVSNFVNATVYGRWSLSYMNVKVADYDGNCGMGASYCGSYCACRFQLTPTSSGGGCVNLC